MNNRQLQKLCFFIVFWCMTLPAVKGNNIRTDGIARVELTPAQDSLLITFNLSWDNSWRDDYNWDAVWLFVKCRKKDMGGIANDWWHFCLGESQSGNANIEIRTGNSGNNIVGVFAIPRHKGHFNFSGEEITLRAPLNGIPVSDIQNKRYFFAVTGIEMVMVPFRPYYLGDNKSNGTFRMLASTTIKPEDDIIGTDPAFRYSAVPSTYYGKNSPEGPADRTDDAWWKINGTNIWYAGGGTALGTGTQWIVNFGTRRTIRTFGVSWGAEYDRSLKLYMVPTKSWTLEGSVDSVNWNVLSTLSPLMTSSANPDTIHITMHSYPVQNMIRVTNPGSYQYYRLNFSQTSFGKTAAEIANVAMSEEDLFEKYTTPYYVYWEDNQVLGRGREMLYSTDGTTSGTLPANYPKGFNGFYVMKYELSQEQYVNFLNMLTYDQQKNRIGNNLDVLAVGQYVFGDPHVPNARNGIVVFSKEPHRPAMFANNLNPALPYFGTDDGQTLPCNYLTPDDMLAYLDWAGLRPLSEMEYEKACRRPEYVVEGEYAWNTTGLDKLNGAGDLSEMGTENEKASGVTKNANAGNPAFGPIRCGGFATTATTQQQAGASYYGVMELSGNLAEMYYSIKGGSGFVGLENTNLSHGDGEIDQNGYATMGEYWPDASTSDAFIVKGGSFADPDGLLRVSDRSRYLTDYIYRDSTVGVRGGRSVVQGIYDYSPTPLTVAGGKTVACPGETLTIVGEEVTDPNGLKVVYVWWDYSPTRGWRRIPGADGKDLVYSDFENVQKNNIVYHFQRDAITSTGIKYSELSLTVPNTMFSFSPTEAILDICSSDGISAYACQLGGTYEWSWMGNPLTAGVQDVSSTNIHAELYTPRRIDFGDVAVSGGTVEVVCTHTIDGCKQELVAKIKISPDAQLCPGTTTPDIEGNVYDAGVALGCRCWMAENINVGNFEIASGNGTFHAMTGVQKICHSDNPANCTVYGGLYSWYEAVSGGKVSDVKYVNDDPDKDIQGICPEGWHIPSDEEWKMMLAEVGVTSAQAKGTGWIGSNPGIQMKSTSLWVSSSNAGTNSSGLNMLPGGSCGSGNLFHNQIEKTGTWWASTNSIRYRLDYNYKQIHRSIESLNYAYSIRCVKNVGE